MKRSMIAVLLGTATLSTPAVADTMFRATLTHDQEVTQGPLTTDDGAPRPTSFGSAILSLNDELTALSMWITVQNIDFTGLQTPDDANDNLLAAHIHAPAPPGSGAGVVWGFIGAPFNDNNPSDVVVTPFADGVGGQVFAVWNLPEGNNTTLGAQLPNILGGLSYLNFHTVQYRGGEIRGQILEVPDQGSTLAMVGLGMIGLATLRLRCSGPGLSRR